MPIIKPKGMIIKGQYHRPKLGTVVFGRQARKNIACPNCFEKKKLRRKEKINRLVPHVQILTERIFIQWEGYKYHCKNCGRYFREQFPGLLKQKRYSEAYRKEVFNLHKAGVSQVELSRLKNIGTATVERWFHQLLERKNREYQSYSYPTCIGLDEHRFTRKTGLLTTLCDLNGHRVLDVYKGRSESQIKQNLMAIPGREKVLMVNMDLCETYLSLAQKVFPNAIIVADRFHVVRLVNQHFLKTIQSIHPEQKNKKRILSVWRKHEWNFSEPQKAFKNHYFKDFPHLLPLFEFKQKLMKLLVLKRQSKKQCRTHISQLLFCLDELNSQHFSPLKTLAKTIQQWIEPIAAMWRFTKTNSITEGFHRKMKLIQRRAYGFKNFENYRLRVRVLCGSMNLNSIYA